MQCDECRFWDDREYLEEDDANGRQPIGFCRRRSPFLILAMIESRENSGTSGDSAAWPITSQSDWCGEFQAKNNPSATPHFPYSGVCGNGITSLNLPRAIHDRLKQAGISYVGDLVQWSDFDLFSLKQIGECSMFKIKSGLALKSLLLSEECHDPKLWNSTDHCWGARERLTLEQYR